MSLGRPTARKTCCGNWLCQGTTSNPPVSTLFESGSRHCTGSILELHLGAPRSVVRYRWRADGVLSRKSGPKFSLTIWQSAIASALCWRIEHEDHWTSYANPHLAGSVRQLRATRIAIFGKLFPVVSMGLPQVSLG